jgi:hypothetical protein
MKRRDFFKWLAAAGMATAAPAWANRNALQVAPRLRAGRSLNSARNVIFIRLDGGPSHVDMWDLKLGSRTPEYFGGLTLPNGALWPDGLMPNLHHHWDKFSLIRSLRSPERNHERGQFITETANPFVAASVLRREIPSMGTVVAAEFEENRREDDLFPTFVTLGGRARAVGPLFEDRFGGFFIATGFDATPVTHAAGEATFARRRQLLEALDPNKGGVGTPNGAIPDLSAFWDSGAAFTNNPAVLDVLRLDEQQLRRYGGYFGIGQSLALAYQMLQKRSGARFIEVTFDGWDRHAQIYSGTGIRNPQNLDQALAALLEDLSQTPGITANRSLLDETIVVAMGEFGRTPGELNRTGGRDHYGDCYTALIAGGGVQGGRVIGATNDIGAEITDPGWSGNRPVSFGDLAATIYSMLDIDWTKIIADTPSSRLFWYVKPEPDLSSPLAIIDALF